MIVLLNGCFDPLHYGHLLHMKEAKGRDDLLYVSVTRDKFVNKGPDRPVFNEKERLAMIRALRIVDIAFLCDSSIQALRKVIPDVFVKGSDYRGKINIEDVQFCRQHNIQIVHTDTKKYSSTQLLKHYELRGCPKLQSPSGG